MSSANQSVAASYLSIMSSATHDDLHEQQEGSISSLFHSAIDVGNDDDCCSVIASMLVLWSC
jgi:hypothetical protein